MSTFVLVLRAAMAVLAFGLMPVSSWAADDFTDIRNVVNTAIRPVMAEYNVPGMAVAVTVGDQPIFFNYGLASKEAHTLVDETTIFEIGSISKTFAATLALYAQALGKLSLDDPPGMYMPQLKGSAIDKASLLELGTYTAGGLPLQFPQEVSGTDGMMIYFQQWVPDGPPGVQRKYSNPSIGLLGHITGLALNSDYVDAVETQLFPKLGLHSSTIRVPESAMADYAWGYDKTDKPIRVNPGVLDAQAYGVKSTAADMIRFVQANIAPSQLPGPMRRAVTDTHIGFFKIGTMVQGLGWEQYPYPVPLASLLAGNDTNMVMESNAAKRLAPPHMPTGPTLFNKTGSTNGFGAYAAFVPKSKIGIVMLANKNFPVAARIKAAHAILAQLDQARRSRLKSTDRSGQ